MSEELNEGCDCRVHWDNLTKKIDQQNKLIKEMSEALDFYGNKCDFFEGYPDDDLSNVSILNVSCEVYGKRARQALESENYKQWKGE